MSYPRPSTIALLAMAALTLLAACSGGASDPPVLSENSPTPTEEATSIPEPSPSPEAGGMDGFRTLATLMERALAEEDASFFSERGVEESMTCTGDEKRGPCLDQLIGTTLTGISSAVAQSDAIALFDPNEYEAILKRWFASARPDLSDEYGDGGLVIYALSHRRGGDGTKEAYQAIVTGIFTSGTDALRQARVMSFRHQDGTWGLIDELFAETPSTAVTYLSGECADCYDRWQRWEGT